MEHIVAPFSMMLVTFLLVVAAESVTSTPFDGASVLRASRQLFLGGTSPPPSSLCMNTSVDASDNCCDSPGSELPMCAYGADCVDCAPRMPRSPPQPPVSSPPRPPASAPAAPSALCINTVTRIGMSAYASDGCCDDGGPGAEDPDGQYDCTDFLEHCVRARCETGRKEHVGVGEEGRSRDVLDGESGWLSSSASTGWRALNAKRSRLSFTYQPSARGRLGAPRARLSAAILQASTAPRRMPLCWPSSLSPPLPGSVRQMR